MNRNKWAAVIGVVIVSGFAVGAVILSLEPSQEERNIIHAVNNQQKVIDRNGHIKKVRLGVVPPGHEDHDHEEHGVTRFEAEVLNEDGVPIGKVVGRRIEGFGTAGLRYYWDGEMSEEEERAQRRRAWEERRDRRAQRDGQQGHDHGDRDGQHSPH